LLIFGMLAVLLFLMFSSQRKRQRQVQQLQTTLKVGCDVITTAGLHAKVVELDDSTMLLETAPGQQSRWDRRAVAVVLDGDSRVDEGADEIDDQGSQGRPLGDASPDDPPADRPDDTK
jgi:preprotein translocase subunit YajC